MSNKANLTKFTLSCGTVEVGDVFYSSWGYDQTNVTFYQVVSLHGKTTVTVREINAEIVEYSDVTMTGYKKPVLNSFKEDEEPLRRRVVERWSDIFIRIADYESASKIDHKDAVKRFSTYA